MFILLGIGFTNTSAYAESITPANTIVINNNNNINFPRRTIYTTRVVYRHRSLEKKYGYLVDEDPYYYDEPVYTDCHASTGCYRVGFARPARPLCRYRRATEARPARPLSRTKVRCTYGGYHRELIYEDTKHIDRHKNSRFRASNQIASNKKTVCNGITYYGSNPCKL